MLTVYVLFLKYYTFICSLYEQYSDCEENQSEILMDLRFWSPPEYEKVVFGVLHVCVWMCAFRLHEWLDRHSLFNCTHHVTVLHE